VYGSEALYDLLEVATVNSHNREVIRKRLAAERARNK